MVDNKRPTRTFNGLALLVAMFRELDPPTRRILAASLGSVSPMLLRLVDYCDFIYSDLTRLDERSLQRLMVKFSEDDWALAWKLTSDPVRQKLLAVMPRRKHEQFLELVRTQPKVPKARVIRMQVQIALKAREMLMGGSLSIRSRSLTKK